MEQKKVKIHGLKFNKPFGTIQVCDLKFDEKQNIYVIKGAAGQGKTTAVTGLQLGIQGGKTLVDKNKYGAEPIDIEIPLTDGDFKFYVSCKRGKAGLNYTLFTKDENGKKNSKLQIDGIDITPAEYLNSFQTALTWRMNELVSENPSVQKKILLTLYQKALKDLGVIFDKKSEKYKDSILDKIEKAEEDRNLKDMLRKQKGGISEDLKAIGIDTSRNETFPEEIPISEIDKKIKAFEKEKTIKETDSEGQRNIELANIKTEAQKLITDSLNYNSKLKADYDKEVKAYDEYIKEKNKIGEHLNKINESLIILGYDNEVFDYIMKKSPKLKEVIKPTLPSYIPFSPDGQKVITSTSSKNTDEENQEITKSLEKLSDEAKGIIAKIYKQKIDYINKTKEEKEFDPTEINEKIKVLEDDKILAKKNNEKVDAVNSFLEWQKCDGLVKKLNNEYVKMLASVDTGVKGLEIVPEGKDIFIMYDGSYDVNYFHPRLKKAKMQKLSAYSTSQRPIICMMIQNYLLSHMDKVMRYIFIDNIPIDKGTKAMIEKMSIDLDLHVFLNMTGDFDRNELKDGEILIEGGEVFFN
jgi:hypothetical protein